MKIKIIFALIAMAAAHAAADYVETFEGGVKLGEWRFGSPFGYIENSGGNPGAYFRDPEIDTFAPQPHTAWGNTSIFTGNYRQNLVESVGIDLITHRVDFSAGGRPLSVLLVSDNGTPNDFDDDWAAYHIGPNNVPEPGQGWRSFDFAIDAQAQGLPAGWDFVQFGINSPPNPDWNDLITDVAQLRYFYGDPTGFFIFQVWDVGMDNARIGVVPEPSALAGLGLLAGLFLAFRRRF